MESRINHFPVLFPCLNLVCIMQIVYNCKGVYVICRRNEMGKFIKRLIAAALTLIMTLLLPECRAAAGNRKYGKCRRDGAF